MIMINESLRLVRVFHRMSQTDLACEIGISKSYLSEIESGKKNVSIELLNKYSKFFNIPTSSLMLFSENLNDEKKSEKVRVFVADKVVKMLSWISETESDYGKKKAS